MPLLDLDIKICKSNILPCFGETAFKIITIQDLEHFIDAYILLGNTHVKNIIVTIKQLFAFAKENNFIKEDIAKDLKRINILFPALTEQSRIVTILDTFEASIANLEAQLKEREKQYEYYRNKLLTFE